MDKIYEWLIGAALVVAAILGFGAFQKRSGKDEAKAEIKDATRDVIDKQVAAREEIEKQTRTASDDELDAKLRKHSRRDD